MKIKCYRFTHKGINFTLVDTPGFDDSSKSDEVIVNHILEWLASSFRNGFRLTGILYLHRIIDPRIGGEARQKMRMFRKLCGPDCMKNVVLGTTFWNRIAAEKGATREKELAANDEFWGIVAKKGSRIVRIVTEDRECGLQILHDMAKNDIFIPEAQREMIEESKSAHNSSAAKTIHEEELEKMKTEMEAQIQAQRAKFENDLSRLEDERREKRRQDRRQQSKIAAAQAKAAADKLATAQQEYWANFVLEQQIAEIAAEEVRERQTEAWRGRFLPRRRNWSARLAWRGRSVWNTIAITPAKRAHIMCEVVRNAGFGCMARMDTTVRFFFPFFFLFFFFNWPSFPLLDEYPEAEIT